MISLFPAPFDHFHPILRLKFKVDLTCALFNIALLSLSFYMAQLCNTCCVAVI